MSKPRWTIDDLPKQDGKVVVITGANSGIGYEAALALAGAGAHIVMACRKEALAQAAIGKIREAHPSASREFVALNLASLASVRAFAAEVQTKHERLDVLVNNAGVMALPYCKTEDGFEMQLIAAATVHLTPCISRLSGTESASSTTPSPIATQAIVVKVAV